MGDFSHGEIWGSGVRSVEVDDGGGGYMKGGGVALETAVEGEIIAQGDKGRGVQ